ncbi:MAG TPA: chromosome segregation protein SMC [Gemmatimonadales bacterium]|nr:chromosome segregation protein SMC [Gemmatimonadales bacterium]
MKLTRIELTGFKSFADSVTLHFEEGVTAIVGPNGCGKSNVSDAVRWVLGEQSARLLRGSKMEDVIFQGAATRRPVNLTEVSLYLDNSDGDLPIAYQEVVITRRLSRSGQSDYLLNRAPTRLRDIQDLLRGTGLGSDAGVVIEAKMIDLLLSDRAEERRSLFEEAAGIGLYRDRKENTERRLEETAQDLQRVEDLIAEVQSQIRSLARQRGKAERYYKLNEEKFAVQLTLARRLLEEIDTEMITIRSRRETLAHDLPQMRETLGQSEQERETASRSRAGLEAQRTDIARRLGAVRVDLGKLDGDLALAAERLGNASARRVRAADERGQLATRSLQAAREREIAEEERGNALAEQARIQSELTGRSAAEDFVRQRLTEKRTALRGNEEELQRHAQTLRSLEGERAALESDLASLRERESQLGARRSALQNELESSRARHQEAESVAEQRTAEARHASQDAERNRHQVAELRREEALNRATLREAEELVAQLAARRQALEDLERDRVGLAPGAAALLAARDQFGGSILGPLSDFIDTGRADAELAERLLGDWVHAVLVRDTDAIPAIQRWHAAQQPGAVALLPVSPGPTISSQDDPLQERLLARGPAERWVRALLSGSEVLETGGRMLRRANGAILLAGAPAPSGPLRRRADIQELTTELARARSRLAEAEGTLQRTMRQLGEAETALERATLGADLAREAERQGLAARDDAARLVANLAREHGESESQHQSLVDRIGRSELRMTEINAALTEGDLGRARLEENLGTIRAHLAEFEVEQESARETRVRWQVQEAHVAARVQAATERLERASNVGREAEQLTLQLTSELDQLDADTATVTAQQLQWQEQRSERRIALLELEAASADVELELAAAEDTLLTAEADLASYRNRLESMGEEYHRLELQVTEEGARKRSIIERVEAEWKKPIDLLLEEAPVLDLDRESLENEAARIVTGLEQIGPINPLAVEEHAEESKRLDFLTTQRDDLVAGRQSLQQAIREIDGTARTMFLDTFNAVQANFLHVFQTLFGGGECDLRLANPDEPLESEIDIHAAPRGKRTQRIHLLSSGERTLVAVSLLFSIYLTKPSPFCLMDEVDAPLDDANVGRFTRLLDEFKKTTQFIVITHNPRTMQAADAVYGVTMQEPGVSTIVGVRLGEREPV